jgi:hypothetical protein
VRYQFCCQEEFMTSFYSWVISQFKIPFKDVLNFCLLSRQVFFQSCNTFCIRRSQVLYVHVYCHVSIMSMQTDHCVSWPLKANCIVDKLISEIILQSHWKTNFVILTHFFFLLGFYVAPKQYTSNGDFPALLLEKDNRNHQLSVTFWLAFSHKRIWRHLCHSGKWFKVNALNYLATDTPHFF